MIKIGDKIPAMKLMLATPDGPREVDTAELLGTGKVVLFATPGAFTPTCSAKHVPGFVKLAPELKEKGVDKIVCMAVNDAFVLGAWAKEQKAGEAVAIMADGSAAFTKALGLELDLTARGMGIRSQRFALVIENGSVTKVAVEEPGGFEVSRAETILESL